MKVLNGQSLIDIAIQQLGSAEGAFALALLNGLSLTDELVPGQELVMPDVNSKSIATYYSNKGIKPATASDEQTTDLERVFFEELPIEFV